jgi:hypothetical protein
MTPASSPERRGELLAYIDSVLSIPAPEPAKAVASALSARYPGAAIFLYGSGISVSATEDPAGILFDYYVIAPDYGNAIGGAAERFAAKALPPNVYYIEIDTSLGRLRAKYALLCAEAFERLVSTQTFHSYFWARFAQPMRLVDCPQALRPQMIEAVAAAAETFLGRAQGLAPGGDWRAVWLAAMNASYRAELRAEGGGRAEKLIDAYGEWPRRLYELAAPEGPGEGGGALAWRLRAVQGGFLSVARLLKATTTFKGGLDYIAWKVKRHAGVDVGVKPWERRHPFFAAPIVALRYYRMRAAARR